MSVEIGIFDFHDVDANISGRYFLTEFFFDAVDIGSVLSDDDARTGDETEDIDGMTFIGFGSFNLDVREKSSLEVLFKILTDDFALIG